MDKTPAVDIQAIMDSLSDGVYVCDGTEGSPTGASRLSESQVGPPKRWSVGSASIMSCAISTRMVISCVERNIVRCTAP